MLRVHDCVCVFYKNVSYLILGEYLYIMYSVLHNCCLVMCIILLQSKCKFLSLCTYAYVYTHANTNIGFSSCTGCRLSSYIYYVMHMYNIQTPHIVSNIHACTHTHTHTNSSYVTLQALVSELSFY